MIDLHTHTFFSDGELVPAELVRRAAVAGYRAMAITDHADKSNTAWLLSNIVDVVDEFGAANNMQVLAGVELTHVPPQAMADAVLLARDQGAELVVVHGETIVEPVMPGTNLAAIKSGADILAHPGLITPEEVQLAAEMGVCLEITTRKGHSLTNGHVAKLAAEFGAKLVINNDAHAPSDLLSADLVRKIVLGAGMTDEQYLQARKNSEELVAKAKG
ncbi:MAG: histidinol phosphate phosphatase domain-containing protein [Deltaproteobacteria bacterium]|jgi:histidinol phosphatase-like PHP family hydrolase|nr:histidinol phosphate phosphatase domain-containing protein [Deltaproteobacteria bacterium]MCW8893789.1 histidinol phosphate phosphatase domain-containing protein [Deltaproteobacteria bacterium]MCW9049699.1 histidinol phosphate phosphatase domain-containing protein [Deltaproteobacteria bacterium]